ncbi:MAG: CopD family protein [Thiomargarita sp.]|nr:CopD family protein [Thiomargarita sp.]
MSSAIYFSIALILHLFSTVIWIGGMFFAHFALRPVATSLLDPPLRLPLMSQVLTRFFPWVWGSVILLWVTGFGMNTMKTGLYIHIMMTIAAVMTVIFVYIFFLPFPKLKQAIAASDFPQAGTHLTRIRHLIHLNLWLGIVTIMIGAMGQLI